MATRTENVSFRGSKDVVLAARLDLPAGEPIAHAVFAHCFTCSKDLHAARRISGALAERGIAVLRFDFTGLGRSEGDFARTDFSSNVDDIVAAAAFLSSTHRAPKLLVGHSLGGVAVLAAAARLPDVVAVATVNAPYDPAHVVRLLGTSVPEIETRGQADVTIGGRSFRVRKELLDDLGRQDMRGRIRSLGKALLVFHAPNDQIVDVDDARRIFEAARHPKSFISLDDADHLLTDSADALYVGAVLAAWVSRYLADPMLRAQPSATSIRTEPEEQVARESRPVPATLRPGRASGLWGRRTASPS